MEPEETQAELYDFLYRDAGRLASYYAQLFSGRLTSLEETDTIRDAADKGGKLSLHVISGDVKSTQENTQSQKRIIDPHDLITTDVLVNLVEGGRISRDLPGAKHGSLVMAEGTLTFADSFMLEMAVSSLDTLLGKPKTQEERQSQAGLKWLKATLQKIEFPSAFILRTPEGHAVAGTVKNEGMEEPISTYYFRHGADGLPGVFAVGIKEVASESSELTGPHILAATAQAARALRTVFFPAEAVMITPLAMFRKL
jgi:hypothetical protein